MIFWVSISQNIKESIYRVVHATKLIYNAAMFDRCLYFNTNRLAREVGKIWQQAFSQVGLAPAHAYLLRLVIKQPGMAQKDIAAELHLEKSTITRFVDKMVAQQYLTRRLSDSQGHKQQLIYPTQKTIEIGQQLEQIGDSLYQKMISSISQSELIQLVEGIKQAANKL